MWLSFSLDSYSSLAEHFRSESQDTTRDSQERAKFTGLLRYLQSTAFVRNLSLMADALEELSQLSKDLQSRTMTIGVIWLTDSECFSKSKYIQCNSAELCE